MPHLSRMLRRIAAALLAGLLSASPAAAWQVLEGPSVTPESGVWWTPEEPGRAVVIEVIEPDLLFAGLLLYAQDGSPTWYVVEARGSGAIRTGALQAFVDGQTLDGAWRPNAFAGSPGVAGFTFESATAGWLDWAGGRSRIERYDVAMGFGGSAAPRERGAWWFNGMESGRGFFVETRGNILFLLGTMYDERGRAVWYAAQGPMTTSTHFEGALTRTAVGPPPPGDHRQPLHTAAIGTLTLSFNDGTTAAITTPGGRQVPLVRYGLCLEVQRTARIGAAASQTMLPGFPWPGCGPAPNG